MNVETERVYLRKFIPEDESQILKWGQNPVYKRTAGFSRLEDHYQAAQAIKQYMERPLSFGVILKENDQLIGIVELSERGEDQKAGLLDTKDLGLMLNEKYWGQHIMNELLPQVIDYAREELQLRELWAGVYPDNIASKNLIEKFGFEYRYQVDYSLFYKFSGYKEDYYCLVLD